MLTTVPPNMLPLSGAKTSGRFVPANGQSVYIYIIVVTVVVRRPGRACTVVGEPDFAVYGFGAREINPTVYTLLGRTV